MIRTIGTLMVSRFVGTSCPDADVQAFLSATGITNATIVNALCTLVGSAKANGWWTKCYAIYPLVGGTSATCAVNLKSPGTYDISWTGSPTFASTGVSGWSSSNYGNTGFVPSSVMTIDNNHILSYSRTNVAEDTVDFGAGASLAFNYGCTPRDGGDSIVLYTGSGGSIGVSNSSSLGCFHGVFDGRSKAYKNGSIIINDVSTQNSQAATNVRFGYVGTNAPSTREVAFATLGTSVTATEAANMYTDIQTFQTALSRNV